MTDIATLAQQAIAYLGPLLPLAAAHASTQFADGFFKQPGAKLFDWLANKFKGTPSATALDEAVADPTNEFVLKGLETRIAYIASKDPDFLHQLTELLKELAQSSVTAPQTANIKGDNNKTAQAAGSNIHIHIG